MTCRAERDQSHRMLLEIDVNHPAPVDSPGTCWWCDEATDIANTQPNAIDRMLHADEVGANIETGQRIHRVCLFRNVIGHVAHIEKRCSCFVAGSSAGDPPNLTRLAAAEAALAAFRRGRLAGGAT
jgi:hypothetical protein